MTFNLVSIGWPNTAPILALAVMPMVALASGAGPRPYQARVQQIEPAAICLTLAECPTTVASAAPETVLD
jgi:hypothetical protein